MTYTHLLVCPVCGAQLSNADKTLKCANAHTFDIAREGYVNLLLKKLPGDTKEMLVARRNFLERGYYRPLSDAINELVYSYLRDQQGAPDAASAAKILDAGCGEGYYAGRLQQHLSTQQAPISCRCIGMDISKEAARMAAKRYKDAFFVVANLKERLVLVDDAVNVLLNIFAPRNAAEFARVSASKGLLLLVIPGPMHLLQLRSALHLLSIEENKQQSVVAQFADRFELLNSSSIAYELQLHNDEIAQAVMMTPNYWHLSDEMRRAMEELADIRTEAEFVCLVFRRN